MKAILKLNVFFLFLIILFSFNVNAQVQSFGELYIIIPPHDTYKFGYEDSKIHIHVFDANGNALLASQTNCTIHVYNNNNNHILEVEMGNDSNGIDKFVTLNSSILSYVGDYSYTIWCIKPVGGQSGAVEHEFYVTNSGKRDNTEVGSKWLSIILSLLGMTGLLLFITTQIKDKLLKPIKIVFFAVSVVNGLFLGVLSYIISVNPYDIGSYSLLGLAYASINVLLIMGFIFNYAFVLFARIYKRNKDRWVNSFKGGVNK